MVIFIMVSIAAVDCGAVMAPGDGTELVRAFGSVVEPQAYPHNLVALGGVLYFEDASDNGGGLWRK